MALDFNDKHFLNLLSFFAKVLDWNEKDIKFLPCLEGYLILNTKNRILMWIHKFTIEATLKVAFDMTKDAVEELIYTIIIGGSIIREVVKNKFPEPPKQTIIFSPGLYTIEYGNVIITDPDGKLNSALELINKTVSSVSDFVTSSGQNIAKIFNKSQKSSKRPSGEISTTQNDSDKNIYAYPKPVVYIQIIDALYSKLTSDKKFRTILPPSSGGYEFRTAYIEQAAEFLKLTQTKGQYNLKFQGERKILF